MWKVVLRSDCFSLASFFLRDAATGARPISTHCTTYKRRNDYVIRAKQEEKNSKAYRISDPVGAVITLEIVVLKWK